MTRIASLIVLITISVRVIARSRTRTFVDRTGFAYLRHRFWFTSPDRFGVCYVGIVPLTVISWFRLVRELEPRNGNKTHKTRCFACSGSVWGRL